jgi:hypothetical protein
LFRGKAGRSGAVLDAEFWINAFEMLADRSGFDPEDCCDLSRSDRETARRLLHLQRIRFLLGINYPHFA